MPHKRNRKGVVKVGRVREFETGATRDRAEGKPQLEGYLSPLVIARYGQFMLKHQVQSDGRMRAADNWQRGIPREAYLDSAWRHFLAVWLHHRGYGDQAGEGLEDALCALMFNVMGYLHEQVRERLRGSRVGRRQEAVDVERSHSIEGT